MDPAAPNDEVLVVAAKHAWSEYLAGCAYICQAYRSFRPTSHMAFYDRGSIQLIVPRILDCVEDILLTAEGIHAEKTLTSAQRANLLGIVRSLLSMPEQEHLGKRQKVLMLSDPRSPETLHLKRLVLNDKRDKHGGATAFVYGHRYVSLNKLMSCPDRTSLLE